MADGPFRVPQSKGLDGFDVLGAFGDVAASKLGSHEEASVQSEDGGEQEKSCSSALREALPGCYATVEGTRW